MYTRAGTTYFGGNGGSSGYGSPAAYGGSGGYESGAKRLRTVDAASHFFGGSPAYGSAFAPAYYPPSQPRTFPVVRLRGLPFNCTENNVCDFFSGLDVVDVLLVHKNDRFTGEAFCVFGAPVQVEYALRKDHHNMGNRYIEVFRAKKQDYYQAIANECADSRHNDGGNYTSSKSRSHDAGKDKAEHTGVLKLRGLPFSATVQDIVDFFEDYDISESDVQIVCNADGRATGEAYVDFHNSEDSKAAMKKDRMTIGSRYVELFPSTPEAFNAAKR